MDSLLITGGHRLQGTIAVSGAKNAALPLMAAALMVDDGLVLDNVPQLADIASMCHLLDHLGIICNRDGAKIRFTRTSEAVTDAPYDIVSKMRASVLVLGPLLARYGRAKVSLPGGCAIGTRPIDLHIMAMRQLGAEITLDDGYILAEISGRLQGNRIDFPLVSVGATENAMTAAALAAGESVISNAACEPEIIDLGDCLNGMGAKISGHGTNTITIQGVSELRGYHHRTIPDRIEAGSLAIAAAMTGGQIELQGVRPDHLDSLFKAMEASGATIDIDKTSVTVSGNQRPKPVDIVTEPYPGFPTDLQAQFMAMMTIADGQSKISEMIFENRFMHAPELNRMGADIRIDGGTATIQGRETLQAAPVMATDLRASVSLVLAGLVATGDTTVQRIYHLERGYERLAEKLNGCGAKITRIKND